ncbi:MULTISPECIES: plantazolicin family TOMM peptide [unclassified Leifsonia]
MTVTIPPVEKLTVSVHGEGSFLFEPTAARCSCTTIACCCCSWG